MGKYKIYFNTDSRNSNSNEINGGYISVAKRGINNGNNNPTVYIHKVNSNTDQGWLIPDVNLTKNLDVREIVNKLPGGVQSVYNSIKNNSQYNGNNRFSYINGSNLNNGETAFGRFVS